MKEWTYGIIVPDYNKSIESLPNVPALESKIREHCKLDNNTRLNVVMGGSPFPLPDEDNPVINAYGLWINNEMKFTTNEMPCSKDHRQWWIYDDRAAVNIGRHIHIWIILPDFYHELDIPAESYGR